MAKRDTLLYGAFVALVAILGLVVAVVILLGAVALLTA